MISREYPTVLKRSKDRESLEKAHSTIILKKDIYALVFSYVDEDEVEEIRFTGKNGSAFANWKDKYLRFDPNVLTIGIVLHEVAHIIAKAKKKNGKRIVHGELFINTLDGLIKSENEYRRVSS